MCAERGSLLRKTRAKSTAFRFQCRLSSRQTTNTFDVRRSEKMTRIPPTINDDPHHGSVEPRRLIHVVLALVGYRYGHLCVRRLATSWYKPDDYGQPQTTDVAS